MGNEILFNSPALHALQRRQLVSLSKRYGLKAGGKNIDMIQRLKDLAATLGPDGLTYIPPSTSNSTLSDGHRSHTASPTPGEWVENLPSEMNKQTREKRTSDQWEVLSESGASLISPQKGIPKSDSVRSWKSAGNGESMNEFGMEVDPNVDGKKTSSVNSVKALASSIKRTASRHLLNSRSASTSSRLTATPQPTLPPDYPDEPQEEKEQLNDLTLPSPASTVGVPKRHSTISLLERPSTIRLVVSPTPTPGPDGDDDLPSFPIAKNIHNLKERRSMAPIRSPQGSSTGVGNTGLGRKSMPALSASTSASLSSIYPPLPALQLPKSATYTMPGDIPPVPPLPPMISSSSYLPPSVTSPTSNERSGLPTPKGITRMQFSAAAQAVLQEMNAKLPQEAQLKSQELLKGKNAVVNRLV
ncbi:hypothetical protein TREMEDRAFT_57638, partial [Tremella mesenterica DSM 1558]|uniref:uncharacterized protein n=1 Tax=Tremella mesenterica (strain ATCC 24925 / CBS 8224 / DSM 1558 / NBRC 9311 / NRRL Y-6157 / RJB 2259-6 / UBC 559-6) TaxID=578456 RepID=UPI0003F48FCA